MLPPWHRFFISVTVGVVCICFGWCLGAENGDPVSYAAVQSSCQEHIRRWANLQSSSSSSEYEDFDWLMEGSWQQRTDGRIFLGSDAGLLHHLGDGGTFQFSSLQSLLDRSHTVTNITGHFYLGNPSVDPIPPPLILDASGLLYGASGEICLACCPRSTSNAQYHSSRSSDCRIRATIQLHYPIIKELDTFATGTIESLTDINKEEHFPTIDLSGSIHNIKDEELVRTTLKAAEVVLIMAEVAAVLWQVGDSWGNTRAGSGVSILGVAMQGGALVWRWAETKWQAVIHSGEGLYRPLWQSKLWVASTASEAILAATYGALILVVLRARLVANGGSPPIWAALVVAPPYIIAWHYMSWEAFLEVVLVLWLFPQVAANAAANLGPSSATRPLARPFLVGVSACRLLALAHPDILQHLPASCFRPLALGLVALLVVAVLQETRGGRFFCRLRPRSPSSAPDAHEKIFQL